MHAMLFTSLCYLLAIMYCFTILPVLAVRCFNFYIFMPVWFNIIIWLVYNFVSEVLVTLWLYIIYFYASVWFNMIIWLVYNFASGVFITFWLYTIHFLANVVFVTFFTNLGRLDICKFQLAFSAGRLLLNSVKEKYIM
jgi:hypothetical protein